MTNQNISKDRKKAFGAYYTPDKAVNFMINWAVRESDHVIDPSYGDGNFLRMSVKKVENPSEQIYGVEFDEVVYEQNKQLLAEHQISLTNLHRGDFFSSDQFFENRFKRLPPFEAVVGNPPFIRYQKFKGEARKIALDKAAQQGVTLPGHVSSWAPFFVHAISLVKPGGRLAMVTPAELGHAAYARQVLNHLIEKFAHVFILMFQKRLFPKLSEDTFIVLGSGKESTATKKISIVDVQHENSLEKFSSSIGFSSIGQVRELSEGDLESIKASETRLIEYLLNPEIRMTYRAAVKESRQIHRFGNLCDIKIGYVTGNNSFFHLSNEEIDKYRVEPNLRKRSFRRSRDLQGISATLLDWEKSNEAKKWLLSIPKGENYNTLCEQLKMYLAQGKDNGVLDSFKVSSREPWFSVSNVEYSDAFLAHMSTEGPRLVQNELGAVAPNTLHIVDLKQLGPLFGQINIRLLLISWYTSLTFFSAEIEGHSLGGGMLKLEPGEARKLAVAYPSEECSKNIDITFNEIDKALRERNIEAALDIGDEFILQDKLLFSKATCVRLRNGYHYLRNRRLAR